jgi:hypothetical protein
MISYGKQQGARPLELQKRLVCGTRQVYSGSLLGNNRMPGPWSYKKGLFAAPDRCIAILRLYWRGMQTLIVDTTVQFLTDGVTARTIAGTPRLSTAAGRVCKVG